MGTRNLTAVYIDGQHKIAQYGQWDGYPEGQGVTVLAFIKKIISDNKLEEFKDKVRQLSFYQTDEQLNQTYANVGIFLKEDEPWINMEQADRHKKAYPELSRDTAADILEMVFKSEKPMILKDDIFFAADNVFCEWAYVVDLDKEVLEVYGGFTEGPAPEGSRFSMYENPVKLVTEFKFDELPERDVFVKSCDELAEDEED